MNTINIYGGTIPESDLPVKSPGASANIRYEEGGKSYRAPMPEVTAAAAAVQDAVDQITADAEAEISQLVGDAREEIDTLLSSMGYLPPVEFEEGIYVDSKMMTVEYDGQVYAPIPSEIPFTTTSSFDPAQWRVIQGVVASDLMADNGSGLVGFKQDIPSTIHTTLYIKASERVSAISDFGCVADGLADDTENLQKAFDAAATGVPVWLGDSRAEYRITSPISVSASAPISLLSDGAKIVCDFPSPVQRAVTIQGVVGKSNYIGPIHIDGMDKAFVGLRVISETDANASIIIDRPIIRNIKRSSTAFTEGNGIFVTGDFDVCRILHPYIQNVTMAEDAGVMGAQGVNGIAVRAGNGRPRLISIIEPFIDNVSSDDLGYTSDQDGILVWTDRSTSSVIRPTTFHLQGGYFRNCLGRSVKVQTERAYLAGVDIYRDTGFTETTILPDIDLQVGGGRVTGVTAHYIGTANKPQSVVLLNTPDEPTKLVPIGIVDGVQVTLTGFATLQQVVMCASRGRTKCVYRVNNVSVAGAGVSYIARLVGNVDTGNFSLSVNGADAPIGTAAVWATTTAGITVTGSVTLRDVINTSGTDVPAVTCNLTNFRPTVSAHDCYGLTIAKNASTSSSMGSVMRVTAIGQQDGEGGVIRPVSVSLSNGQTFKLPASFANANSGILVVSVGASRNDQGIFACDSGAVVSLASGSGFSVGTASEPGSGDFRLWSGTNGPSISNRSGTARVITIFMIG